jgi:hypothetical protein
VALFRLFGFDGPGLSKEGSFHSLPLRQMKEKPEMSPTEINTWAAFLIIGVPLLVVLGGGLILHMAIALAALALFFSHPAIAIALAALWFFPWRWLFAGFALGEGLKWSGVFGWLSRRRPRYPRRRRWDRASLDAHDAAYHRAPPRSVGRRPADYNPWPGDEIDMG